MKFDSLAKILQGECALVLDAPLVLGFSGGPDSLALLHALQAESVPVLVAHFDHGLRPESAEEAHQAEEIAAGYSLPFFTERGDVAAHARQHSMSIEEAARELRYEYLFGVASSQGAQAVAVAHNADDQVETVLMHLLRGAGPRGLRGMALRSLPNPWSAAIPLVRPLLGFWRQEILDYCRENGLQPVRDQSNLDTTYFRNRLRHELFPTLEQISPGIMQRLHRTADLLTAETEVLEELAEGAWKRCLGQRSKDYIQLNRPTFMVEPLALRRFLLRRAAQELRPGLRDLDYEAIQRALDLAQNSASAPGDWVAGLCLLVEGDHLWVADWEAELPVDWPQAPTSELHIEAPASLELNRGWRFELHEAGDHRAINNSDPFQAWLDQDSIGDELVLRRRHPGDRFQPLGMESGSQKLADFMINEKLPKRARETWPLLCKGEDIVWVPGYRLAHPYRLRKESRRVLQVKLLQSNGRVK